MSAPRVVLDTGALIRLQEAKGRVFFEALKNADTQPQVPSAVLAEWYAGNPSGGHGTGESKVLDLIRVVDVSLPVALAAGRARQSLNLAPTTCPMCKAVVPKSARVPSAVDAMVVAFAASVSNGGGVVVYTADVSDLEKVRNANASLAHVQIWPLP